MPLNLHSRDFLKEVDFTTAELQFLLDLSHDLKRAKANVDNGVFDRFRRVQVTDASGASNVTSCGCGAERQKYVYIPRR